VLVTGDSCWWLVLVAGAGGSCWWLVLVIGDKYLYIIGNCSYFPITNYQLPITNHHPPAPATNHQHESPVTIFPFTKFHKIGKITDMGKSPLILSVFLAAPVALHAAQAPNPRGMAAPQRQTGPVYQAATAPASPAATTPAATTTPTTSAVSAAATAPRADAQSRRAVARPVPVSVSPRVAVSSLPGLAAPGAVMARAARNATTAIPGGVITARSATPAATTARATAIFNDMSKMGTGYAQCYEAYNTCMDQFCAGANNIFRRCFCSDKFKQFRNTESAIDQAKSLLVEFNDNNLNAVDKTPEEVKAMYSATAGEKALKRDTSAASKMLAQIEDLLSGKTTTVYSGQTVDLSSVNFLDISDIWASPDDWLSTGGRNMSQLEGLELYNEAGRQCQNTIAASCPDQATLNMVRSAYSILIAQDCNTYERKVATTKETIAQTVRQAYNILRQARLDEYRAHNSPDVNTCLAKVRDLILSDNVCGPGYKRCLDPTGMYINATTGMPIYSPRLFNLANSIKLSDTGDPVSNNPMFSRNLDTKRKFAQTALDTCQNIADTVWNEFKKAAIIEIAQAQNDAIESVKNTCVSTMKECYDTQNNALAGFDTTTAQASGALAAQTTRYMCADKVLACAALFCGNANYNALSTDAGVCPPCNLSGSQITNADQCGLQSLLTFVGSVSDMQAAEGCKAALQNYAVQICTPPGTSSYGYPYGCRIQNEETTRQQLQTYARSHCQILNSATGTDPSSEWCPNCVAGTNTAIESLLAEIREGISSNLQSLCNKYGGMWATDKDAVIAMGEDSVTLEPSFLSSVYGGIDNLRRATMVGTGSSATRGFELTTDASGKSVIKTSTLSYIGTGMCLLSSAAVSCRQQDKDTGGMGYVTFNPITGECDFDDGWYRIRCEGFLGGTWNSSSQTCLYRE